MKLSAIVLSSLGIAVNADTFASSLLMHARRMNEDSMNLTWMGDMAVKYQGCHHIKQWNKDVDGIEDVRIYTKRLVRFRLCPQNSCAVNIAGGCQENYGDYIIDMDTYINLYWNANEYDRKVSCKNFFNEFCNGDMLQCEDGEDNKACQYRCAANYGREECIQNNGQGQNQNNNGQQQQQEMDVGRYMTCNKVKNQNNNNKNNNNNGQNQNYNVQYYIGPYCAEQGGAIKLGIYTDDKCTEAASDSLYALTGMYTKYTDESLVDPKCTSCIAVEANYQQNNNNNNYDQTVPREMCQVLYQTAGKCETNLYNTLGKDNINQQACNYMSGIKMVRTDGLLDVSNVRPSAVATAFIVVFAMAFAAMGFYVWYLRTRLGGRRAPLL